MSFLGGFNKLSNMLSFGGVTPFQGMPQSNQLTTALGNKALDWVSKGVGSNSPIAQINNSLVNANDGMANLNNRFSAFNNPSTMFSLWSNFKED